MPDLKALALELLGRWQDAEEMLTGTFTPDQQVIRRTRIEAEVDGYKAAIEACGPEVPVGVMGTFRGVPLVSVAELAAAIEQDRAVSGT